MSKKEKDNTSLKINFCSLLPLSTYLFLSDDCFTARPTAPSCHARNWMECLLSNIFSIFISLHDILYNPLKLHVLLQSRFNDISPKNCSLYRIIYANIFDEIQCVVICTFYNCPKFESCSSWKNITSVSLQLRKGETYWQKCQKNPSKPLAIRFF